MVIRKDILNFLDNKMQTELFQDFVPNGLQIEGISHIKRMAFATSATTNVIQKAVTWKADALFVHHGFFWRNEPLVITGAKKKKIQLLIENNINLIAYHLPLDALAYYGNNYPVLVSLGCKNIERFEDIGYIGTLLKPILVESFFQQVDSIYNTRNSSIHINPAKICNVNKICVVSGNGVSYFPKLVEYNANISSKEKVQAFISGEGTEWVYEMAYDNQMVYSAVGHNISEEIGPNNIKLLLEEEFSLQTIFIKEKNPF